MEIAIQTMTDFQTTLALARWAESRGLAGLAVADHYLRGPDNAYALDQLTVLAAVAAHTDDLSLSTLVSPITFRHPAVLLKMAQTLDEISGGRFSLGVGAGWMDAEHHRFGLAFPPVGERFDRLTEALAYLQTAISADTAGFTGTYYKLAPGPSPEPIGENIRIIVGGGGARRTPRLAGTYAHEFNLSPSETPFPERIERARTAAAGGGRDPQDLMLSTAFPLVVGTNRSEVEDRITEVAHARGTDPGVLKTRWAELGIPMGTVDEVTAGLDSMATMGITRVYLQVAFDRLDRIHHSVGLLLGGESSH